MSLLTLSEVTKRYGGLAALDKVSLCVSRGDFIIIEGASGSGKTTLLKVLGGLAGIDAGSVFYEGIDLGSYSEDELAKWRRRSLGLVFQQFRLISYLSALDNVALPLVYAGMPDRPARQRAARLLALVGLSGAARQKPGELSGGQAQRAALARSLANYPGLILCDEPTGALDPPNARWVMEILRALSRYQKTIIVVTHDRSLEAYGNRIFDMERGRLTER